MVKWEQKLSGRIHNPYCYEVKAHGLTLQLTPPYKSDPWDVRLLRNNKSIHKDYFRFRNDESSEDPALWESIEDMEMAKEEAFAIMEEYIGGHARYWNKLHEDLESLKGDVAT